MKPEVVTCDRWVQAANEELEYLSEIESQLLMLNAREAGDLQALQDIQVLALPV